MLKKLIIVADDFTGANDTGVQFKNAGFKVNVIINTQRFRQDLERSDILVVDLESRFDTKEVAYLKCFDLGKQIRKAGITNVYKKLDSTFRGNIGAEFDGLMDALNINMLFLASAWPSNGRTTKKGDVFVNGVRLSETESNHDPRNPIKYSSIEEIIRMQSKRKSCNIPTEIFDKSFNEITDILHREMVKGTEIFIFDSYKEEDLDNIANLIETFGDVQKLIAGSGGLASHLSSKYTAQYNKYSFVFSGSITEKTRSQLRYTLNEGNCRYFHLESEYLLGANSIPDNLFESVSSAIKAGIKRYIFTSALTRDDVENVLSMALKKDIKADAVAEKVARRLGTLAAELIVKFDPSGVLLTGGDIAIKTVNALNATGISIDCEILPGISAGTLTGCNVRSIVATKSGGFGGEDAISRTFEFFKV